MQQQQQLPIVIVAQSDASSASRLASALHNSCRTVYVAKSPDEVRNAVPKQRADVLIVDLEMVGLPDVQRLHHEYGNVSIVATHRVADEEMWAQALQAGAVDCCYSSDVRTIVSSALSSLKLVRARAA